MNPTRLGLGIVATAAVLIAWMGPASEPQPAPANTAPMTVLIQPVTSMVTTTSTSSTTSTTTTVPATTTTTFAPALLPVDHVCYEWLPLLLERGWPADPDILATALTIMWRESRCQPTADSGPDHGLFQVNRYWCNPSRYSDAGWLQDRDILTDCDDLFDPATNVTAALAIWLYSEQKNGDGFLPWTTYSGRP